MRIKAFLDGLGFPRQLLIGFALAAAAVWACDRWWIESILVPSGSMEPTVVPGERLFISRTLSWPFATGAIARFDVVIVDNPQIGHRIIKRVIGLPGECVVLRDGYRVDVNGRPLQLRQKSADVFEESDGAGPSHLIRRFREPGLWFETIYGLEPGVCLAKDEYYVLGDHRWRSKDSRSVGPVKRAEIEGRALWIWLSVDRRTGKMNWPRLGTPIQ